VFETDESDESDSVFEDSGDSRATLVDVDVKIEVNCDTETDNYYYFIGPSDGGQEIAIGVTNKSNRIHVQKYSR
jgi:hypothetical protein